MASRYWKRNEKGELVEFFPNQASFADGPIGIILICVQHGVDKLK